jgi:lysyl-tRNA synthetase class 2
MGTDYRQIRIEKLEKLREAGIAGYAYRFAVTHSLGALRHQFDDLLRRGEPVAVAGRMMANRRQGRAGFAHIQDREGRIQLYFREEAMGVAGYGVYRRLDIGDIVGIHGRPFTTRTGEATIEVKELALLAKALRPLPEKWHGLRDIETRSRLRYVDLIMSPDSRRMVIQRMRLVAGFRRFLDERGFIEVETPILQTIYGGAFAKPFTARYEALDTDFYLRISDELYLKRLIVGGLERVYEIGKDFRNEGMDRSHNPEFTMLELYQAYADYTDVLVLCEEMLRTAVREVTGGTAIEFEGRRIDFGPPWRRLRYVDALNDRLSAGAVAGIDVLGLDRRALVDLCRGREIGVDPNASRARLLDALFSTIVEPDLIEPTFILDYPRELSPLAKVHRSDARLVERFEPYAGGMELGNAFSEQNDPLEQRAQFEYQMKLREEGDLQAQVLDEDYLRALEFGMPPTGGLGIGIDRLCMLLSGQRNIREVILFPHLRPQRGAEADDTGDGGSLDPKAWAKDAAPSSGDA